MGCQRVMVMTDPGIVKAGLAQLAEDALSDFHAGTYDKIPPDPDLESIDLAVEYARKINADCIVSVGGGSVIDSSKAVCVTLKNGGKVHYHLNLNILEEPQTPHIVIPTSGSGSEVTSAAVITCHAAGRKLFMASPHIIPNAAILDPRFAMTLPKRMTVGTAMDSMTHAVEAMMGNWSNRISDAQALQAVRLIYENLPLVVADGKNETARHHLQIASTLAGWAFAIAQVGLAHCMAHTLGTICKVPHGEACGLVLPKVMRFNVDHATKALVQVARALDVNTSDMEDRDAALAAADAMEALMEKVGHPMRLRDVGVKEEDLPGAAFHAVCDLNTVFNPRRCTDPNEIMVLFEEAF